MGEQPMYDPDIYIIDVATKRRVGPTISQTCERIVAGVSCPDPNNMTEPTELDLYPVGIDYDPYKYNSDIVGLTYRIVGRIDLENFTITLLDEPIVIVFREYDK